MKMDLQVFIEYLARAHNLFPASIMKGFFFLVYAFTVVLLLNG